MTSRKQMLAHLATEVGEANTFLSDPPHQAELDALIHKPIRIDRMDFYRIRVAGQQQQSLIFGEVKHG